MSAIGGEREWAVRHFEKGRDALAHLARGFEFEQYEGVLLPAYLCESMLRPFKDAGLNVEFYSIFWTPKEMGDFLDRHAHDWALLKNDLFGEHAPFDEAITFWSAMFGNPVVHDATMSIMSNHVGGEGGSKYTVASLRKTTSIDGAILCRRGSEARAYITALQVALHDEAERRRENLKVLMDGDITVGGMAAQMGSGWYNGTSNEVVPSHAVLEILGNGREALRQWLIKSGIYATVHWALPPEVEEWRFPKEHTLSRRVLSIPIDGRYDEKDMAKIIKALRGEL